MQEGDKQLLYGINCELIFYGFVYGSAQTLASHTSRARSNHHMRPSSNNPLSSTTQRHAVTQFSTHTPAASTSIVADWRFEAIGRGVTPRVNRDKLER